MEKLARKDDRRRRVTRGLTRETGGVVQGAERGKDARDREA